jgi:hypothetical protein
MEGQEQPNLGSFVANREGAELSEKVIDQSEIG